MALNIDPEQIDVGDIFENGQLIGGTGRNLRTLLEALDSKLAAFGGTPDVNSINATMIQDGIITGKQLAPNTIDITNLNFSLPAGYASAGSDLPVGSIVPYAGPSCPTGWLCCDGSPHDEESDPILAALLGVGENHKWGATNPGAGKFNVPDFRGRALIGMGEGGAYSKRDVAEAMGSETHTLTSDEMPVHTHGRYFYRDGGNAHFEAGKDKSYFSGPVNEDAGAEISGDVEHRDLEGNTDRRGPTALYGSYADAKGSLPSNVFSQNFPHGGGQSHENMQPSIVVNWLIKNSAAIPDVPLPLLPGTGAAGTRTQQMQWSGVPGASSYDVQVSTVAGNYTGANLVFEAIGVVHVAVSIDPQIPASDTYYWHVSAKNASGSSAFSTEFNFVVP